jgi:hypothetical protein
MQIDASGWARSGRFIQNGGAPTVHAFFADTTGPIVDLNSLIPAASGWMLESAQGINNAGQIAGSGMHDGTLRAYRLTPSG